MNGRDAFMACHNEGGTWGALEFAAAAARRSRATSSRSLAFDWSCRARWQLAFYLGVDFDRTRA
jgi:hypothetical protein